MPSTTNQNDTVSSFVAGLPGLLLLFWLWKSGLLLTDAMPGFLAVAAILCIELMGMLDELFETPAIPYNAPDVWYDKLVHAISRATTLGFFSWLVLMVNDPYFLVLRRAVTEFAFPGSAIWLPYVVAAILLVNTLYHLAMGLRFGRSPPIPGRVMTALIWFGLASALWFMGGFIPASNGWLGAHATSIANLFIVWIYLRVLTRNGARLVVMGLGRLETARSRAMKQEEVETERQQWRVGNGAGQ